MTQNATHQSISTSSPEVIRLALIDDCSVFRSRCGCEDSLARSAGIDTVTKLFDFVEPFPARLFAAEIRRKNECSRCGRIRTAVALEPHEGGLAESIGARGANIAAAIKSRNTSAIVTRNQTKRERLQFRVVHIRPHLGHTVQRP